MTCDQIRAIIAHRGRDPEYVKLEATICWGATAPGVGRPGAELKALLAEVGLTAASGCGCNDKARQMDVWGPQGCRERREEIACWLAGAAEKAGWAKKLAAGMRLVLQPYFRPLDPYHSLVDEAVRRAELKAVE